MPDEKLKKKIKIRLKNRLRSGMAIELHTLQKNGVPWKRFHELGFDQKYIALYLRKKITPEEMLEKMFLGNWKYAKRQMTWFKRDKDIHWFDPSLGTYKDIKKKAKEFLLA